MRSVVLNNEFFGGKVLELGKMYAISDDFNYRVEGVVVSISDYLVNVESVDSKDRELDVSVEEGLNVTIMNVDTRKRCTMLVEDIDEIIEIYR